MSRVESECHRDVESRFFSPLGYCLRVLHNSGGHMTNIVTLIVPPSQILITSVTLFCQSVDLHLFHFFASFHKVGINGSSIYSLKCNSGRP